MVLFTWLVQYVHGTIILYICSCFQVPAFRILYIIGKNAYKKSPFLGINVFILFYNIKFIMARLALDISHDRPSLAEFWGETSWAAVEFNL